MSEPLRVLCLDIEGGYGGSSRSLYHALKHIDRARVAPTVWCRRHGPIRPLYEALGIPVAVAADMPKASALPRLSRNLWQAGQHARQFLSARSGMLPRLLEAAGAHDLVHFNHEALAMLALWLRRHTSVPATMHIRTQVQPSVFGRAQMRAVSHAVDAVVFITPNEEATFRSLGGSAPGRVIFNIADAVDGALPHEGVPRDERLKVASLANAAVLRGTDRLVEIASVLRGLDRRDIAFVMAGDMKLKGAWPGELARFAASGATLADAVGELGLSEFFVFLGHVTEPERVLAACDVLIKPTRDANPWGRDILEGMAAGRPVVSLGTDTTFVESDETGQLHREYSAAAIAAGLAALADDRAKVAELGRRARERVSRLCSGPDRARDLADLWCSTTRTRP